MVDVLPRLGPRVATGEAGAEHEACVALAVVFSEPMTAWRNLPPGTDQLTGVLDWLWVNLGILAQKGSLFVTRPTLATHVVPRWRLEESSAELFDHMAKGRIKVEIERRYLWAHEPAGAVIVEVEVRDPAQQTGAEMPPSFWTDPLR